MAIFMKSSLNILGCGSNAMTCPLGPTASDRVMVCVPMCAPMSSTVVPGLAC